MSAYLLLRNNKESGPYTLNDLVTMGLKAYDLIWVQGKSAAWRYPSELEELKPYAPQVEEQPFDRFFKKNTEEKKTEPVAVAQKPPVVHEITDIEEKYQKYIPKRSVVVTLPGQKEVAIQKPVSPKPSPQPEPLPTVTVSENPVAAQVKYSQPLDEIKEMYVKTLQDRKTKIARKGFMLKNVKRAAVIAGLIAAGVLAGFMMRPGSDKKDIISQTLPQSSPVVTNEEVQQPATEEPVQQENNNNQQTILPPEEVQKLRSDVIIQKPSESRKEKSQPTQEEIRKETTIVVENKKNEKSNTDKKKEDIPVVLPGVETNTLTGERNRKVRDNNLLDNYAAANNSKNSGNNNDEMRVTKNRKSSGLESFVSVSSNNYIKVAFGGIRNLELTVTNDSKFVLDKVIVELQYLKPSEQPFRTEMIQFRSVAPNESVTKRIQDTNRGIKVSYKIVDIQSAQSETATAGF